MILAEKCSSSFTTSARLKSADNFHGGRVEVAEVDLHLVEAVVEGAHDYDVEIEQKNGRGHVRLLARCTCPHFREGNLCKHTWAVILAADERHCYQSRQRVKATG